MRCVFTAQTGVLLAAYTVAAAQGEDNCTQATDGAKYTAHLLNEAQTSCRAANPNKLALPKVLILRYSTATTEEIRKLTPLFNLLNKCSTEHVQDAKTKEKWVSLVAIKLVHAPGASEPLAGLAAMRVAAGGAATAISGTDRYITIRPDPASDGISKHFCSLAELLETQTTRTDGDITATKVFSAKKLTAITTTAQSGAELAMCCVAGNGNDCGTGGSGTHLGIKGHKLVTEATQTKGQVQELPVGTRTALALHTINTVHADSLKHAEEALHKLQSKPLRQTAERTPHSMSTDPQFRSDVWTILMKQASKATFNSQENDQITNAIKAAYGNTPEEYDTGVKKKIKETKGTTNHDDTSTPLEIKGISDEETLEAMLAVARTRTAAAEKKETKCITDNFSNKDTKSISCKNKNKDECDKEDKCAWKGTEKDGKCEIKGGKDEVKQENDWKQKTPQEAIPLS